MASHSINGGCYVVTRLYGALSTNIRQPISAMLACAPSSVASRETNTHETHSILLIIPFGTPGQSSSTKKALISAQTSQEWSLLSVRTPMATVDVVSAMLTVVNMVDRGAAVVLVMIVRELTTRSRYGTKRWLILLIMMDCLPLRASFGMRPRRRRTLAYGHSVISGPV